MPTCNISTKTTKPNPSGPVALVALLRTPAAPVRLSHIVNSALLHVDFLPPKTLGFIERAPVTLVNAPVDDSFLPCGSADFVAPGSASCVRLPRTGFLLRPP